MSKDYIHSNSILLDKDHKGIYFRVLLLTRHALIQADLNAWNPILYILNRAVNRHSLNFNSECKYSNNRRSLHEIAKGEHAFWNATLSHNLVFEDGKKNVLKLVSFRSR